MAEEPRRSGRATKGQHKNAATSPAPSSKPPKAAKTKPTKKSAEPEAQTGGDDDDEVIRCICGNTNPKDRRPFIGCDNCTVWQHNVCMGLPDDEDEVPDQYFCEECRPEEHKETLHALARGDNIWETRNKIYQTEKKLSKRGKHKSKANEETRPGWLRKEATDELTVLTPGAPVNSNVQAYPPNPLSDNNQESGGKRKRDDAKPDQDEKGTDSGSKLEHPGRQEKKRKPSVINNDTAAQDAETALLDLNKLPADRRKIAQALSKIIEEDVSERFKAGLSTPDGSTANDLGNYHASRIEYALYMVHGGPKEQAYGAQFRALNANLKQNRNLVGRLLDGEITADLLSRMTTSEMASEELQRERAVMKEALDRQAVAVPEQGPRYKQDHKGYRLIEDENETFNAAPPKNMPLASNDMQTGVKFSDGKAPISPMKTSARSSVDTSAVPSAEVNEERQAAASQFDMSNIWAKTAHSPTSIVPNGLPRSTEESMRRSASIQGEPIPHHGAKEDPEIDRMLQDNDDAGALDETTGAEAIVWRGKLIQSNDDSAPVVNARFVAGRDITSTIAWQDLLPAALSIDGRLQIQKAEDYLCGLRWSSSSDVSVLALTPYDNAEAFNTVFDYFHTRLRYAVVEKDKPKMVKDLYIIPLDIGAKIPSHIGMLEHCTIKQPVEERLLLATIIVARAPDTPPAAVDVAQPSQPTSSVNGLALHQRMLQNSGGPAGSPLTAQTPIFAAPTAPQAANYGSPTPFPANPYGGSLPQHPDLYPMPHATQTHSNTQVSEVLGELQFAPTAQTILSAAERLTAEQLHNLKAILTDDPSTRTDINALARKLYR